MAKGDYVEVLVDAGGGTAKEYLIHATRAGRRIEVKTSRSTVEVNELSRTGSVVRTARFMAPRVLAIVEHPNSDGSRRGTERRATAPGQRRRKADRTPPQEAFDFPGGGGEEAGL